MPCRLIPQSLRTICMKIIMKNLGIFSTTELQRLPNDLSEALIDLYTKQFLRTNCEDLMEYYFRFTYRNRLIKPNSKKLNLLFPKECKLFVHKTLTMISETCKSLTHLRCDFVGQSHLNLHQLVISLPNVIELKLIFGPTRKERDDDDVLEAIGNNCFQLENLHLNYSRITNNGVRRLCQSKSAGAKIKELKLLGSRVKVKGCLTALCNLKQLRRFICSNQKSYKYVDQVSKALRKLFEDSNESIPTFQLCELPVLDVDDIPTGFLRFVMACCPNVRDFHLQGNNNFVSNIKDLGSCNENVYLHLKISNVNNFMANLGCCVGCRVTELHLWDCQVHLPTIGFTCPYLTDLKLCDVIYMPVNYVATNNSVVPYRQLRKLTLSTFINSLPIPFEHLQFLLENCLDLQTLNIDRNDEFTDDVMVRILRGVNPLRHLAHFEVCECDIVSSIGISELLQADNELTSLKINSCRKISRKEILQIESLIRENNFFVTLDIDFESDVDDDDDVDNDYVESDDD